MSWLGQGPSPASSSTKPSSIIASLRNVSWHLAIGPISLSFAVKHDSTSDRAEFIPLLE